MRFYAFDSFAGLPSADEVDATGQQPFRAGEYCCSKQKFLRNLRRSGADMKRVITVPWWYHESLRPDNPRLAELKIAAVVWVDCDLYSSCIRVLDFVTRYVQYGTLVCFDDWFRYKGDPNAGEQRAFHEWLAANPNLSAVELMRIGWEGNCFIVRDKDQHQIQTDRPQEKPDAFS
jgi:hypothetical protein